jgi:C-terminal region of Mon2 protein
MLPNPGKLNKFFNKICSRSAFQCLQLVFTDFLPTIPYRCYPICVETASKFGSQRAELNVSLTAIGLLWNLSDYFFQNVSRLQVRRKLDRSVTINYFPRCIETVKPSKCHDRIGSMIPILFLAHQKISIA